MFFHTLMKGRFRGETTCTSRHQALAGASGKGVFQERPNRFFATTTAWAASGAKPSAPMLLA